MWRRERARYTDVPLTPVRVLMARAFEGRVRWAILAVMGAAASSAQGQALDAGPAGVVAMREAAPTQDSAINLRISVSRDVLSRRQMPDPSLQRRRLASPLASAAIPGLGQALLGESRALAYIAVEAVAWWRYSTDLRSRAAEEERFKEVASRVARAQFSTSPPDSDWHYYEMMRDYTESGYYSRVGTGPVVPDTNANTFNGSRWRLALSTNPDTLSALRQYARTAVRQQYYWSWTNARFSYDIFIRDTDKRNDANRAMVHDLLVIGANHVLSMVDAFTTMRLEIRSETNGRTSVGARLDW
jgi:hypothetical protein